MDNLLLFYVTHRALILKVLAGIAILVMLVGSIQYTRSYVQRHYLRKQAMQAQQVSDKRDAASQKNAQAADATFNNLRGQQAALHPTLDSLRRADENLTRRLGQPVILPARR